MAAAQQLDPGKADGPNSRESLKTLIRSQVVHSLGTPDDMLKVQVYPVGNANFRVNVVVGKNASAARIADSFFLTADEDGNIVASSPKIARLY